MNSLSWLLYLADVFGDLEVVMWILAVPLGAGGGIFLVATIISLAEGDNEEIAKVMRRLTGWIIFAFILCSVMIAVIPSKTTMYAVAASEMGEELMKTPTATKAVKALDAWLDKQIAETTKEASQ